MRVCGLLSIAQQFFPHPTSQVRDAQADPEKTSVQVRFTVLAICFVGIGSALGSLPQFTRLACGSYLRISKRCAFVPCAVSSLLFLDPEFEQLLEQQPIDGVLVAFRNHTIEDSVVIVGLATVVSVLGGSIYMIPRAA